MHTLCVCVCGCVFVCTTQQYLCMFQREQMTVDQKKYHSQDWLQFYMKILTETFTTDIFEI